jgi:hypothetical protein
MLIEQRVEDSRKVTKHRVMANVQSPLSGGGILPSLYSFSLMRRLSSAREQYTPCGRERCTASQGTRTQMTRSSALIPSASELQ